MSSIINIISLNITEFPQNLLIPGIENKVKIQVINISNKAENFKFNFEGENLNVNPKPDEFKNIIEFDPGETKNIELFLEPTIDGYGKLTIKVNWLKITEVKVKVEKVRDSVPNSNIKKILERQAIILKEKIEPFNPNDFFIGMTKDVIKKAEQQLNTLREEFKSAQSMGSSTSQLLEKIEAYIIQLAKGYLSINNPLKALKFALMLSNNSEKLSLYTNLLRAYATRNFETALQIVNNLQDLDIKQNLIRYLALDYVLNNPEQAIRTALLIQNPSILEDLLIKIYSKTIESNPVLALNLVNYINNNLLKSRILFNIAKKLHEQNSQSELLKIYNLIIQLIINLYNNNIESRKLRKQSYGLLNDAINAIAELDSPSAANSIIERIANQELKEKVIKNLFDIIYIIVDEIQSKVEATPVFSQYFLLNTYISNIRKEITNFSLNGGNVSNNILKNDFNFSVVFISLFGFDFSIFPILDRVYNDLKYSLNKSIAYYILPLRENYNENVLNTLKASAKQFFKNLSSAPDQTLIFNLDFIPYLGKPTIILSSGQELSNTFYSKIKKIGDTINLMVDDSIFKAGKISDELTQIFPSPKSKIINLVLSYEFINDYNIFKTLIQSLL
ncbi:MAG: hypothetical protein ACFE8C_00725 [Promethearchaeota archaeon]